MKLCDSKGSVIGLLAVGLAGLLLGMPACTAAGKDKQSVDKIPKKVMDGLYAKFPKAQIDTWTQEKEGEIVVYDFEFRQAGGRFEADIKEDGTIHNWERAIAAKDLPETVRKAVEKRYPQASMKEIMLITAVKNGKDEVEGYEIVLETAEKKEVEVMVAPDGKILEDTGDAK